MRIEIIRYRFWGSDSSAEIVEVWGEEIGFYPNELDLTQVSSMSQRSILLIKYFGDVIRIT